MFSLVCRKTGVQCKTPSMCSPFGGCGHSFDLVRSSDYDSLWEDYEELYKLVLECVEYLNTSEEASIRHDSILHQKLLSTIEYERCDYNE